MPRASWKGFIRLSLVSVPVQGYTASASSDSQIALNQLHSECHSRIRYKKTCPIHGEVASDEIVMGYEYAKDQYAVIDPSELDKLRTEADRAINVDRFVDPSTIDPTYFSGQTYYLAPNGRSGEKPYALLNRAMTDENVYGLAQVVINKREQLVALRPVGKLLAISMLQYASDVRQPSEIEELLGDGEVSAQELKLAKTLVDATRADDADLEMYQDLYAQRMKELVDAKVEGHEVATPPQAEARPVINLMDALKASLGQSKPPAPSKSKPTKGEDAEEKKPAARKTAAKATKTAAKAAPKRKSA